TQQQKTENKFLSSYHQNKPCSLFPVPCSLSKLASFIEGARYEFSDLYFPMLSKKSLINYRFRGSIGDNSA
ncbi:hypothetical protein, partial [Crocosphaera sp.]|uniref:hypothetical protein n=1 Tax=Crocosphaera sp. TaxID=2729996 RepID=UPI003F212D70